MALTLRLVKGKALTYAELDNNFSGLASSILAVPGQNYLYNGNFDAVLNAGPVLLLNNGNAPTAFDAWTIFQNTAATGFVSQVPSGLQGAVKAMKLGRPNGDVSGNALVAITAVKTVDSIPLQGQTVTISFWAKAGANFSGPNINVALMTGTGTDELPGNISGWAGAAFSLNTTQIISTAWTRYQYTGVIPVNATEVGFRTFYSPTGTAGADDNLYLTEVQLEIGVVATTFDKVPYNQQIGNIRIVAPQEDYFGNFGPVDPFYQSQLLPYRGNLIMINGKLEVVPWGALSSSGGVVGDYTNCSVDRSLGSTLAVGTVYRAYAYMLNGVMTLDYSTISQTLDTTTGIYVKSGDPAMTLVGLFCTDPLKTIRTFGAIVGGAAYVNGTYQQVPLTGGTGTRAKATVVVSGGAVVSVTLSGAQNSFGGLGYTAGDVLSASNANLGGAGAGFTVTLATVAPCTRGGAAAQTITTWNNRAHYYITTSGSINSSAANGVWVEGTNSTNRLEWVQWGFDLPGGPNLYANYGSSVASDSIATGIGVIFTGTTIGAASGSLALPSGFTGQAQCPSTLIPSISLSAVYQNSGGEGYYAASFLAERVAGAGTIQTQSGSVLFLDHNTV